MTSARPGAGIPGLLGGRAAEDGHRLEGTWYWYAGSTYDATNLTGATAMGLIDAYHDRKDDDYLDAAIGAADFIMAHLDAGAAEPLD